MPLRAVVDGQEILSPLFNDEQWSDLNRTIKGQKLQVTLPCCDSPATLRTSKLGTHHFVHKRKNPDCNWKPETKEHLKAKAEIVLGCHNAGWNASTEVSGENWRADVLATRGNAKIAFEVQWSSQNLEITEERQKRYKDANIRGCWFFRKSPLDRYSARKDLPIFDLAIDTDSGAIIKLNEKAHALSIFVTALLLKKIQFRKFIQAKRTQPVRIVFFEMTCWKCHRPHHVYYMKDLFSDCGHELSASETWNEEKTYFAPEILSKVTSFLKGDAAKHLHVGKIKDRYSRTVGQAYQSFGCPYCDSIVGDHFLWNDSIDVRYDESGAAAIFETEITLSNPILENYPHWCFPENEEFCYGE